MTSKPQMRRVGNSLSLLFLAGIAMSAWGQAPAFTCSATTDVPPTARAEGLTELMGDFYLSCTGGTPTPAGQPLPQFNFTLLLSANVTSKPTAVNQFDEALLIVDEPASGTNPNRPMLNCGNSGAPDSGGSGPAVCSILSAGNPALSYDGTSNGFGTAACDGGSGRPAANSYGCGRPNVFQGRLGTPQSPGQLNGVTFLNVPVDPPGAGITRSFRITNVRADASSIGVSSTYFLNYIQATISATGPIPMSIAGPTQIVAYVYRGLDLNPASCIPSAPARVRVCEGVGQSWQPKNFSFAVGNGGTAGNANTHSSYWVYNGGTNYPPDVAQNVPGTIYRTEGSFQWQNNAANGPPSPNPPFGLALCRYTLASGVRLTQSGTVD